MILKSRNQENQENHGSRQDGNKGLQPLVN
jgi:hypothetical protein